MHMTKFIVIEGLDGSGKSTVTKLLAERFTAHNMPSYTTFEPTKNPIGELMRSILSGKVKNIENEAIALLFAADRYQHLKSEILPALERSHVICDRYYYSSMAYQGVDPDTLERVVSYNQAVMPIRKPDIVFFLNITPKECFRRVEQRGEDISIFETLPELELRYVRYLAAIERMKETDNIVVVGSDTDSPEDVVSQMWAYFVC